MNIHEAIRSRRAVKNFDPSHRITDTGQQELLSLAMQSPTAFNIQHWRFVVVEERKLRQQVRQVAWASQYHLARASLKQPPGKRRT
ncbi:nitroreductase [Actimicrobium sp. GrIS 1.19]|uniref:nitroreductase family protein n=1 Tax=Actimicrobium sp. GrIS 1.19 TaxID=3071708 RepID=UPI002E09C1F1|nr:nitroreductase [Actimicrobium sp. GrIS 1.19]